MPKNRKNACNALTGTSSTGRQEQNRVKTPAFFVLSKKKPSSTPTQAPALRIAPSYAIIGDGF